MADVKLNSEAADAAPSALEEGNLYLSLLSMWLQCAIPMESKCPAAVSQEGDCLGLFGP